MSEQNILNPTAASQLNPTYTIPHKDPQIISSYQPRSGKALSRFLMARGQVFDFHWDSVDVPTYEALRQWIHQYERDFFSYFHFQRNRYYSGQFLAEPQFEEAGNNQFNITATFVEIPGLPMFQYPSNWGVSSVFLEERDGFGSDLVKLTGTWDHGDKNYVLFSEQFDNAAWSKSNVTVTANAATDPNGGSTADAAAYSVSGSSAQLSQSISIPIPIAGRQFTFSVWIKVPSGTNSLTLAVTDQVGSSFNSSFPAATTSWQRFSVTGLASNTTTALGVFIYAPTSAGTFHLWGAQLEVGSAPTTYTQTTSAGATLLAPSSSSLFHGGFAYCDAGTNVSDTAEWLYFGYGFRLWCPKGPDMGLMDVYLDGVVINTLDLYAAASTASAVILTQQNVALAQHRVKLQAKNQKNASSTRFVVAADAIEVMR